MSFGAPIWLAGSVALVAAAAVWLAAQQRRRSRELAAAFATPLLPHLLASVNRRRRWLKHVLLLAGLGALAVALARPQWGRATVEVERTGVDLLIALDVSRSMLAPDVGGTNRLVAARRAVKNLLDSLGGDRAGLILFAGDAFLAVPLTRDHSVVERALDAAGPEMVSQQGSDLAKAIQLARDSFKRGAEGGLALLIVSDGEQLQGEAASAATSAAAAGIRVHCAMVGSLAGARLPVSAYSSRGYQKNSFGRDVVSHANERLLRATAEAGRGLAVRIPDADSAELVGWFREASRGLPRTSETRRSEEPEERFQWPLALVLALLTGEAMLSDRRRRLDVSRENA